MMPVVGVRYKCSICKDYDFCARCEEATDHEHPFLKIYRPEQAPTAVFTVIDENMKGNADIEVNAIPERRGGCHRGRGWRHQ